MRGVDLEGHFFVLDCTTYVLLKIWCFLGVLVDFDSHNSESEGCRVLCVCFYVGEIGDSCA